MTLNDNNARSTAGEFSIKMNSQKLSCGHPQIELIHLQRGDDSSGFKFVHIDWCLGCFDLSISKGVECESLELDLYRFNTWLAAKNESLVNRIHDGKSLCLIEKLLPLIASKDAKISRMANSSVEQIVGLFDRKEIPHDLKKTLVEKISLLSLAKQQLLLEKLLPEDLASIEIYDNLDACFNRADPVEVTADQLTLLYEIAKVDTRFLSKFATLCESLLTLGARQATVVLLKGFLLVVQQNPEHLLPLLIRILKPWINKWQLEIVCGILFILKKTSTCPDFFKRNEIPLVMTQIAVVCSDPACLPVALNFLQEFLEKDEENLTNAQCDSILKLCLYLNQSVPEHSKTLWTIIRVLISSEKYTMIDYRCQNFLLVQLETSNCVGRPEVSAAGTACFRCMLVCRKLAPNVSFDECVRVFAKRCVMPFREHCITFTEFLQCATGFMGWVLDRGPTMNFCVPKEFMAAWIDNVLHRILAIASQTNHQPRREIFSLFNDTLEMILHQTEMNIIDNNTDYNCDYDKSLAACFCLCFKITEKRISAEGYHAIYLMLSVLYGKCEKADVMKVLESELLESPQQAFLSLAFFDLKMAHGTKKPVSEDLTQAFTYLLTEASCLDDDTFIKCILLIAKVSRNFEGDDFFFQTVKGVFSLCSNQVLKFCLPSILSNGITQKIIVKMAAEQEWLRELAVCYGDVDTIISFLRDQPKNSPQIFAAINSVEKKESFLKKFTPEIWCPDECVIAVQSLVKVIKNFRKAKPHEIVLLADFLLTILERGNAEMFMEELTVFVDTGLQIFQIDRTREFPQLIYRALKIMLGMCRIMDIIESENDRFQYSCFLTTVHETDAILAMKMFVLIHEAIPNYRLTLRWDQLKTHLSHPNNFLTKFVLEYISISMTKGIVEVFNHKELLQLCIGLLETFAFEKKAFELFIRLKDDASIQSAAPLLTAVVLARMEKAGYSKRVTAELLLLSVCYLPPQWLNRCFDWLAGCKDEFGETQLKFYRSKIQNISRVSNPPQLVQQVANKSHKRKGCPT